MLCQPLQLGKVFVPRWEVLIARYWVLYFVGLSFVFFGGGIAGGREGVTGEIVGKLYFVEVGLVFLFCRSGIAGGREGVTRRKGKRYGGGISGGREGVTPGRKGKRPGKRYGGGKKERNIYEENVPARTHTHTHTHTYTQRERERERKRERDTQRERESTSFQKELIQTYFLTL